MHELRVNSIETSYFTNQYLESMSQGWQNRVNGSVADKFSGEADGIRRPEVSEESFDPADPIQLISREINLFSSSTQPRFIVYDRFIKTISTTLSNEEQREVHDTFDTCQSLAMTLRTYLMKTRLRVNRAKLPQEFTTAMDIHKLEEICVESKSVLAKFRKLISVMQNKSQEQQITKELMHDASIMVILSIITGLGAAAYGVRCGFSKIVQTIIGTAAKVTFSSLEAAYGRHKVLKVADFGKMVQDLQELKTLFTGIADHLSKIQAYDGHLGEESKQEFLGNLKAAEDKLKIIFQTLAKK